MKHQALARVFSAVLAVMCLLMGINGVTRLGKTQDEYEDRIQYADRYAKRIDTYVELDKELEGSISYDEAYAELEKMMEEHDRDASQHKTDTAMYSAEKGGNTMGADIIWELMPQLKGARLELEIARQQLKEGEEQLQQSKALYEAFRPLIDRLIADADKWAAVCRELSAKLEQILNEFSALVAKEPTAPQKPAEPTALAEPQAPAELSEDADDAARAEHEIALAEYNDSLARFAKEKAMYDAALLTYELDMENYGRAQEEYEAAHADWESRCTDFKSSADLAAPIEALSSMSDGISDIAAEADSVLEELGAAGLAGGSVPSISIAVPEELLSEDPASMNNQLFINMVRTLKGLLDKIAELCSTISSSLSSIGSSIAAGEAELAAGKAQLEAGEAELKKGEAEATKQLELIWYNLGELEKDKEELEESKQKLDKEAGILSKKLMETDELKELENKRTSTKLILTAVKEVKEMYQENHDLVGSANTYLDSYRAETEKLHTGKLVLNSVAIIGGIAGIAGIPAAYEKIRKRAWLLGPVILCLVCACAADGINMSLGLGQMYTALFTAIFAAIQLLVISPKQVNAAK